MKDISKYMAWIVLILGLGFLFRGTYIMLYPFKPLAVHSVSILDGDNIVTAGDSLEYSIHYTKYMPLTAKVHRRLINSFIIPLPDIESTNAVGEGRVKSSVPIPEFADAGDYRLHISWEYTIGEHPDRTIIVSAMSPVFRVVSRPTRFAETNAREIARLKKEHAMVIEYLKNKNARELELLKRRVDQDEEVMKNHRQKSWYDRAR